MVFQFGTVLHGVYSCRRRAVGVCEQLQKLNQILLTISLFTDCNCTANEDSVEDCCTGYVQNTRIIYMHQLVHSQVIIFKPASSTYSWTSYVGLPGERYLTGPSGVFLQGPVDSFVQNRTGIQVRYFIR